MCVLESCDDFGCRACREYRDGPTTSLQTAEDGRGSDHMRSDGVTLEFACDSDWMFHVARPVGAETPR